MRLVLIEWLDSERRSEWEPLTEVHPSPLLCRSVGWLTLETDTSKTIFPHLDVDGTQGCGGMTIPACAVKSVLDLTTVGRSPSNPVPTPAEKRPAGSPGFVAESGSEAAN